MNLPQPGEVSPLQVKTSDLIAPFDWNLEQHGLTLVREKTTTLQINVGYLCNLLCRHCHLDAGPHRREVMSRETMDNVIAYASRNSFTTIDITGGAPEITPHIGQLLQGIAGRAQNTVLRTNLIALRENIATEFINLCRENGISLVASFPSINAAQADNLRGQGFWEKSLEILKDLNNAGYGHPGSGLTLDLVVNPAGAFLPANQCETEKKFKHHLERRGIVFNNLFGFANAPLGRFRSWLEKSGNLAPYYKTLYERFNPTAVAGLMCRTLVSVAWDGYLYDCDFNIAAGLPWVSGKTHITSLEGIPPDKAAIATGYHCYACTAGAGFT